MGWGVNMKESVGLKKRVKSGKVQKISTSSRRFKVLLDDEMFSEFSSLDWIFYFQKKYFDTNKRTYVINGGMAWNKEHSIFKALIKNYTPKDIKLMIDFLFDSSQDIKDKKQVGSYLVSSKWVDSIYRTAKLWQDGEYLNRRETWAKEASEQKENETKKKFEAREWTTTIKEPAQNKADKPKSKIRI